MEASDAFCRTRIAVQRIIVPTSRFEAMALTEGIIFSEKAGTVANHLNDIHAIYPSISFNYCFAKNSFPQSREVPACRRWI
jgi:hypothetical protein